MGFNHKDRLRITNFSTQLEDYKLHSVTGGKDALGEVSVRIRNDGKAVTGRGASTDVIEASIKAYVDAVNRMIIKQRKNNDNI